MSPLDSPSRRSLQRPGAIALPAFVLLALLALAASLPGRPAPAAAQAPTWQRVLDGLYGDRVRALVLTGAADQVGRPLLLLPEGGPLFRSTDGATWSPVVVDPGRPGAEPLTAVRAHDDDSGQRIYAGLRNRPLFAISEDGGATWASRDGPPGVSRLDRMAVSRSGRIYAAEYSVAAIWTSTDRGQGWERQALADLGLSGRVDALFAATDDPVVYAIIDRALYRSTDDPASWTLVLGPATSPALEVSQAAIGPRGRLYAAGRDPALNQLTLRSSEDRGDHWPGGGWPFTGAGIEPRALAAGETAPDEPAVWLGLADGQVLQSGDGGDRWQLLRRLPLAVTLIAADPAVGGLWAGSDGLGLFRVSPEWGQTGALPVNATGIVAPLFGADQRVFLNARLEPERREGGILRPALHAIYQSTGGEAWQRVAMLETIDDGLHASPDYARFRWLFSGQSGSEDGGLSWIDLGAAPGAGIPRVAAVGPITGSLPVVYGLAEPYADGTGGSGLFRSEDGGRRWRAADAPVSGIVAVAVSPVYPEDLTAFFATDRGVIYRAVDGLDFEVVGRVPGLSPDRILYDLVVSPGYRNDRTLLVAVEDPASPEHAQVYLSGDAGRTWGRRSGGLPAAARPRKLALSPAFPADRVVFLGTERRLNDPPIANLLASDTAGIDWYGEGGLPPGAEVRAFAWGGSLSNGWLFAAAGPGGVWRRRLDGPLEPGEPSPSPSPSPAATASASPTPAGSETPPATPPSATPNPTASATAPGGSATASPTGEASRGTPNVTPSATGTATPSPSASSVPPSATTTPSATSSATATEIRPPARLYIPFCLQVRARNLRQ